MLAIGRRIPTFRPAEAASFVWDFSHTSRLRLASNRYINMSASYEHEAPPAPRKGLPPPRRVVTGHTPTGVATIASDTTIEAVQPQYWVVRDMQEQARSQYLTAEAFKNTSQRTAMDPGGFAQLYRTTSFPADNTIDEPDVTDTFIPLVDKVGTTFRIMDFKPGYKSPMHRTHSVDLLVVLKGTLILEMEDGSRAELKEGETLIQRGTMNRLINPDQEGMVRVLVAHCPAEQPIINGKALPASVWRITETGDFDASTADGIPVSPPA